MDAILPEQTPVWHYLESCTRQILDSYGYREFRLPIVERTELFKRSIGEVTDIVEKEMYTFDDLNGDSLSLRPEGTAGCVRAAIDKGLLHNQQQRLWYNGPMFRHEKPQEGRYRQFFQIGIEAFGYDGIDIEFEHLLICDRLWKKLGFTDIALEINTLGTTEERQAYRDRLVDYFSENQDQLDEDSQRRLGTNPLRILDTKNPDMQALVEAAPKLIDHLGDESRQKFASLTALLDQAGIAYRINPRLVRGLDYYSHTVYEWTTDKLGAQGTICAGGRFDGLVSQLGGRDNHAAGFAMGLDRIVLLMNKLDLVPVVAVPHVYLVAVGEQAQAKGFEVTEALRNEYPALRLVVNCGGGSFKSQFKKADKSGAEVALLFGEDELAAGQVTLKYLREEGKQLKIDLPELSSYISKLLANKQI